MKMSLSMLAEKLSVNARVLREVEGSRPIAGIRLIRSDGDEDLRDDLLYVLDGGKCAARSGIPRHAIVVLRRGEDVDDAACAGCESLAVVETDKDVDSVFIDATNAVEGLSTWDNELVEAILGQADIGDVLEIGARMLANPIALFDEGSALVSMAGELPEGYEATIWGRVVADGASPLNFYTRDETAAIARELAPDARPGVFVPKRAPEHANLAAAIAVDGRIVASIGQVDLVSPFTPGQIDLAAHVRNRLQQAFALSDTDAAGSGDALSSLIGRLIDGTPVDLSLLRYHLGRRGWDEDDRYRVTTCPIPEGTAYPASDTARVNALGKHVRDGLVLVHAGAILIVEHTAAGMEGPSAGVVESAGFSKTLTSIDLSAGVGDWFVGIGTIRAFYLQALAALAEAERADRTEAGAVTGYSDIFESDLARLVASGAPVESVCVQEVLALTRDGYKGDVEHGRELVRELYAYLASGRNLNRCARDLFLHRNTLAYRIERLGELLGRDLAVLSPAEVVRLEISCLLALHIG